MRAVWLLLLTTGCVSGVTQVAGTGAIYTTRCSSEMEVKGVEYFARCVPSSCDKTFKDEGVNQVVVAVEPGEKIVGYAERLCVQDLSDASAKFMPITEEPPPKAN
jgi:hypothetical protein